MVQAVFVPNISEPTFKPPVQELQSLIVSQKTQCVPLPAAKLLATEQITLHHTALLRRISHGTHQSKPGMTKGSQHESARSFSRAPNHM
ncbi:hypothetical protein COCSUDRAFT_32863 [Coccomyxa subellipsoidea C-169]|uniref:Uncharacterized protein n=1 Tax=Coccomyxa subellipsoidea (strain C-169) TaxID=574566 RepID=I0Z2M3_COCSC|nr:hypothetical protein COCSUDRAFT_32863 [Coccomyxa subellipsoidea C-169]EIE24892.1 hypothetical protein COCSUDRAFT_32863 [Coccomyxa subellipsoidea C-169]|eukprot:XP_005649436.1 hypothetical protein COCSUDRAFT_32863 [Coccomyxa subellipsoidea C-169]